MPALALDRPHHDGSAEYVPRPAAVPGEPFEVRLRIPLAVQATAVSVRTTPNAEPRLIEARVITQTATDVWWSASWTVENPVTHYRFLISTQDAQWWLNGAGMTAADVRDGSDFVASAFPPPPSWLADVVGYQIFPDRFATSGASPHLPEWAVGAAWEAPLADDPRVAVRQVYGGDLAGVESRLDHVQRIGANLLYLTPVFPGRSAHRYDADTFGHVDPLLGGDGAYASLIAAAHARGIRVIGDLTLNHTGAHHEWFVAAQADASSAEADYYLFDEHPGRYRAWYDIPSLPKLNWHDAGLRDRLITADDSPVRRWMRPPYGLDGWRIDCANVTARIDLTDVNDDVARLTRSTMDEENPSSWLLAEHCYDAAADLAGGGWDGAMAYHWFTRPVWAWLGTGQGHQPLGGEMRRTYGGDTMAASISALWAGTPWPALNASMTMLDSHDCARFRTVCGSAERHVVGMAMLITFPGVPTLFAGDEVGVTGSGMDAGRAPFPWDEGRWDRPFFDTVRALIAIHHDSEALRTGGFRWVAAGPDAVTYLRESPAERILVHVARAGHAPVHVPVASLGAAGGDALFGGVALHAQSGSVTLPDTGPGAWIWRLA